MDPVARKKLNLRVLQRHDQAINDVLDQSAHAVLYKFEPEKQSWEKLGFEGVLFLVRRQTAPYFGLYMLNRLMTENYSLFLTDFENIELKDSVIIYQTRQGDARALWLFEEKDRERLLNKVIKLHESMKVLPSMQESLQGLVGDGTPATTLTTTVTATTTTTTTSTTGGATHPHPHPPSSTDTSSTNGAHDILHMLQRATLSQPPLHGSDKDGLLRLLSSPSTEPHPPSPAKRPENPLLDLLQSHPHPQPQEHLQEHLQEQQPQPQASHSAPRMDYPKPWSSLRSPTASPRDAAALLQTLQGHPPHRLSTSTSTSTNTPSSPAPLTLRQATDYSQQEVERRLGRRPLYYCYQDTLTLSFISLLE
ncbi:hypothetical protein BDF14DRAFT_1853221 [Spinellus fusiger]|nr:hypothetical protein BDF14DRAFT_1853221 [Spinellus fusiger]